MGGAYGGKISPPAAMAAAAALGAMNLNRPVRIILDFRTNMEMIGKRYPYLIKYNVSLKISKFTELRLIVL
jgi:xanthine dehydrogenase molybdopterin-binding subunit B